MPEWARSARENDWEFYHGTCLVYARLVISSKEKQSGGPLNDHSPCRYISLEQRCYVPEKNPYRWLQTVKVIDNVIVNEKRYR